MNEHTMPIGEDELHAYVDGTLSDQRRADVDHALTTQPELAARVSDYFALNSLFHERYDRVLNEPVPQRLKAAVATSDAEHESGTTDDVSAGMSAGVSSASSSDADPAASGGVAQKRWRFAANWSQFAGMAAMLVLGVGLGVGVQRSGMFADSGAGGSASVASVASVGQGGGEGAVRGVSWDGSEGFAHAAAIAHVVYMPDVTRPDELDAAHEQDFVKWLANKLGTDVHPPMLTQSGFELTGGRLLPGDDGPVAQFMYRGPKGERLTLCISHRKVNANTTAFKLYQDGPVNVFYWVDGDYGYALSGGIERKTLLNLSHSVYAQLTGVGGA
ncbi:anti-sigma factor [Paraburkholderia sp.]|uniref:anti-sigma factor family protein n=1 Tax=Paraburkholderia sp. TaxID=1926495 RepID=UPI002391918E|nr:anti-sigma factor [Paraburkholderia sp.]MDE1182547.1 anti-sigma factor [Paraburkholderia sp.]